MNDLDGILNRLRNTEPYLEDHGFTSAVLAQIPENPRLPAWKKNLIMLAATALGSAIVTWQIPVFSLLNTVTAATLSIPLMAMIGTAVYIMCGGALWVASRELR